MAALSGCQPAVEKPKNLPELFPFSVTVLQEGKPVEGAFVRLLPANPDMPWSCGATTGADGIAKIKTIGQHAGAPAGKYKVLVSKLETPPATPTDLSNLDAPVKPQNSESVNLINTKFSLPNTTTLEVEVAKGTSTASFDVGPAIRETLKGPR